MANVIDLFTRKIKDLLVGSDLGANPHVFKDVKIPVGNLPSNYRDIEALTLEQISELALGMNPNSGNYSEEPPIVYENLVERFPADCWTVDGVRSMSFCVVGEKDDGFDVYWTSRRKNDFAAVIWFSEDLNMHPYLSYETKPDYRNCTLSFSIDLDGQVPSISDEELGLVMTVITINSYGQQVPYYLRLANFADPATLTDTHADVTIDWNTARSGFYATDNFPKTNIQRIFIGCLTNGFDIDSTQPLPKEETASMKITNMRCTGTESKFIRRTMAVPQHTIGMCTSYDDSYNVNPYRIIKNCFMLGYRGHINHYCGMSHYYNQKWSESQLRFVVTKVEDRPEYSLINKETTLWHKYMAKACKKMYMLPIFSVSYEMFSEAAELTWTQRDWNNKYGRTGYEPPSYLLSPCVPEAMNWLQQVFIEFAAISVSEGLVPHLQVGEPWWWINSDGKPCIYDYPTRVKFNNETGLFAPEIPNRMDTHLLELSPYKEYAAFLRKELGNSVVAVRTAVKQVYPEALVTTLFFLPSILDEETSGIASTINYPVEQYKYPNLDFIQTETYDWLIIGKFNKALRGFTSAIDELGYPPDLVHYLLGFVPDDFLGKLIIPNYDLKKDGVKVWQAIMGNAYLGKEYNVAKQYIWAYNQVMRDGLVIQPELFLRKFWILNSLYLSQVREGEVLGTPIDNLPWNPVRPPQPETPNV